MIVIIKWIKWPKYFGNFLMILAFSNNGKANEETMINSEHD